MGMLCYPGRGSEKGDKWCKEPPGWGRLHRENNEGFLYSRFIKESVDHLAVGSKQLADFKHKGHCEICSTEQMHCAARRDSRPSLTFHALYYPVLFSTQHSCSDRHQFSWVTERESYLLNYIIHSKKAEMNGCLLRCIPFSAEQLASREGSFCCHLLTPLPSTEIQEQQLWMTTKRAEKG